MTRKEAIEILKKEKHCIENECSEFCPYRKECLNSSESEYIKACELAISSLEADEAYQLEYEQPSGKWIPCSERLPDTEDKVLCWYEYYHWSKEEILPEYGIGQYIVDAWYGEVSTGLGARVIAWQPLPEPYKMESEDKE